MDQPVAQRPAGAVVEVGAPKPELILVIGNGGSVREPEIPIEALRNRLLGRLALDIIPADIDATRPGVQFVDYTAAEITIGPKWDTSKAAEEQTYFREHSANLRQLREHGALVVGARYSDKGFLVLAAPSLEAARAMLDRDPSMAAGVFAYHVHEMSVFYPGTVPARSRR